MLQNIFSHRPPLYDVFNKAELYALHVPCNRGSRSSDYLIIFGETFKNLVQIQGNNVKGSPPLIENSENILNAYEWKGNILSDES